METPPPWIWPCAAYIHVPFCAHHCGYCDFAIAVGQDHLAELYLDALEAEMATLGSAVGPNALHRRRHTHASFGATTRPLADIDMSLAAVAAERRIQHRSQSRYARCG